MRDIRGVLPAQRTEEGCRHRRWPGAGRGRPGRSLSFLATASAVALMAGTYVDGPPSAAAATRAAGRGSVRIVVGGGTDFTDGSLYEAMSSLKHEGVAVSLSVLSDPASALEAVVSGKADVYLGDPIEAATAVANSGAQIKYVGSVEQATDYEILSLPKYTLKNLAGTTMASAGPTTAGLLIANAALRKERVNTSSIHDVTVGGTSARVTAILAKEVDLAPVLAPSAVVAVTTGKVKILLNAGRVLGKYLQEGLIASDSYVKSSSATLQTVINAFITSQRWATTQESAFIKIANANQLQGSLTARQEKAAWQQLTAGDFYAINGALCPADIAKTESYSYTPGAALTKKNTPKYSAWVDPAFVKNYLVAHKTPASAC